MKKPAKKTQKNTQKTVVADFRPYRVLFVVVVISVTCLVLFALLGVTGSR